MYAVEFVLSCVKIYCFCHKVTTFTPTTNKTIIFKGSVKNHHPQTTKKSLIYIKINCLILYKVTNIHTNTQIVQKDSGRVGWFIKLATNQPYKTDLCTKSCITRHERSVIICKQQTLIDWIKASSTARFPINPGGGYGKHRDICPTKLIN